MFNRDYSGRDYAPFDQINTGNVARLSLGWASGVIDMPNGFEGTPIVSGDYLFATTAKDHVLAYQASTGRLLWEYDYPFPGGLTAICCDMNNRGVAVYGNAVFMGTLDGHLVALDARTGTPLWNVALADPVPGIRFPPRRWW